MTHPSFTKYFDFEPSYRIRASYGRFVLSDGVLSRSLKNLVMRGQFRPQLIERVEPGKNQGVLSYGFMYSFMLEHTKHLVSATKEGLNK
jgi:hypothetical protein